jgi:N-acetylmuramoyl-L-alanine amidase
MGHKKYAVKQGDTIDSIAFEEGLLPDTIWDHPDNAGAKAKSRERSVLMPGDVLTIPDKHTRYDTVPSAKRHRYRRRGVPAVLELRLLEWGEPRVGLHCTLEVEGRTVDCQTDPEGRIRQWVPPTARKARLIVHGSGREQPREEYEIRIGHLTPKEDTAGAVARLINLDYLTEEGAEDEEQRAAAVKSFQKDHGMKETGDLDRAVADKLEEVHGL